MSRIKKLRKKLKDGDVSFIDVPWETMGIQPRQLRKLMLFVTRLEVDEKFTAETPQGQDTRNRANARAESLQEARRAAKIVGSEEPSDTGEGN